MMGALDTNLGVSVCKRKREYEQSFVKTSD